jgi:SNF2 family DNA or RNA helicase
MLTHSSRCPLCREHFGTILELVEEAPEETTEQDIQISKTDQVLALIDTILRANNTKIVVFSHYKHLLNSVVAQLERSAYSHFNGSTTARQRSKELASFTTGAKRVLLLSVRSSGCGLNLQCASHIILTEPFINKELEQQCVHRVQRDVFAQKTVEIHKLIVKNTIEETIEGMQRISRALCRQDYQNLLQ